MANKILSFYPFGPTNVFPWDNTTLIPPAMPITPVTPVTLSFIIPPPAASGVSLFPIPASPQAPGTAVLWSAAASGGSGAYEYQFWLYNGTSWSSTPYSASNTWIWNTTGLPNGTYSVQVWARNAGSTAAYEAYSDATYVLQ